MSLCLQVCPLRSHKRLELSFYILNDVRYCSTEEGGGVRTYPLKICPQKNSPFPPNCLLFYKISMEEIIPLTPLPTREKISYVYKKNKYGCPPAFKAKPLEARV